MNNLNKKRLEMKQDGKLSGKKIRSKPDGFKGGVTAEDAELEEFLAILKRLQTGFNSFREKKLGDGAGKSAVTLRAVGSGLRNPGFELGDFKQFEDVEKDTGVGFDLNVDPVLD